MRGSNGWGPNGLRYADIEAWMRVTGVLVRAHEIEWLFALDRAFLRAYHAAEKKKDKQEARR